MTTETTYSIVRFFRDINRDCETVLTGLTLAEAKEHCLAPFTRGESWFDGYVETSAK